MKGVVFCELLKMVDKTFSPDMTESIIEKSELPSKGAYTSIGTYDHSEIVSLVTSLSAETGTDVPVLVHAFGKHLFGSLNAACPHFAEKAIDALQFLEGVDGYIHVEVRKLYPDAELPKIEATRESDDRLVLDYASERGLAELALGLIEQCIEHFGEEIQVEREDLGEKDGRQARFTLTRGHVKH